MEWQFLTLKSLARAAFIDQMRSNQYLCKKWARLNQCGKVDWPSYKKNSRTVYKDGKTIEPGCRISAILTIVDGLNHANLSGHEM